MPSDPRVTRALDALEHPIERYCSAVATTLEEVRGHLAAGRSDAEARALRLQSQLGPFAAGRIDAARLSFVLGTREALDPVALQRLERASDVLGQVLARGRELFHVAVPPGGDLHTTVAARLGEIGRAFSAARLAATACAGGAAGIDEPRSLDGFPFAQWNAAERKLAPPLVVSVSGCDLVAGMLAPFLDGAQKIVLLVDAPSAPAPLVRLIAPSVLVLQGHRLDQIEKLATWPAAGIAALLPETAVRFAHDPSAGPELWQRLSVHGGDETPVAGLGGFTAAQLLDELQQLHTLATPPRASATTVSAADVASVEPVDPVDRLAAWLLEQANLATPSRQE